MNKKAFTLLELLVVVLIIGILAAIALPQYNKAVNKTKFAKLQSTVSSLSDAYKEYVLNHGKAPKYFNDLSITLPDNFQLTLDENRITCMESEDMSCCLQQYFYGSSNNYDFGYISCYNTDLSFGYYESSFSREGEPVDEKYCIAKSNDNKAKNFCSTLGKLTRDSTIYPNSKPAIAYTFYQL